MRCHCCLPGCTPGNRNWERSLDCNPGLAQEAGMLAGIFTALASGCSWEDHKSGFFSSVLQSKVVKRATSTSPAHHIVPRTEQRILSQALPIDALCRATQENPCDMPHASVLWLLGNQWTVRGPNGHSPSLIPTGHSLSLKVRFKEESDVFPCLPNSLECLQHGVWGLGT